MTEKEAYSFDEINRNSCRYILNDGKPASFLFCTNTSKPGSSYCEEHHKLCHTVFVKTKNKFMLNNKTQTLIR